MNPTDRENRPALDVRDLNVSLRTRAHGTVQLLEGVNFSVMPGQAVGLVGESGSGKTMTSLAISGLLPRKVQIDSGQILFGGENLRDKSAGELRRLRGSGIGTVLQDPMTSLDPSFTIGSQLSEPFRMHKGLHGAKLKQASIASLERVQIPSAEQRLFQYPHQFSGGMRQRAMSAIALAGGPGVLIADEPTTALDVTTQAQYLLLLRELQRTTGFALVLITHDLMVVRQMCERVVVMYAGHVVEEGPLDEVLVSPQHPYTRALFHAIPRIGQMQRLESIDGQAPDPVDIREGCRFASRCKFARDVCTSSTPTLSPRLGNNRVARCWGTEPGGWIGT